MSDKSATPILIAGGVGTVILLGIAWMFAASTGEQARLNAVAYAESKAAERQSEATTMTDSKADDGAAALPETNSAESESEAEPEGSTANIEEPVKVVTTEAKVKEEDEITDIEVVDVETDGSDAEAESAATDSEEAADEVKVTETETQTATAPAATMAAASTAITGDAAAGRKAFRKCRACHKVGEGAKHAVGPNLTGVIGRIQGSAEGYDYSESFKAAMAEGKVWTPEELKTFLKNPKAYRPGTKMNFAGLRKENDPENVIAYLNQESGN